jgi:cytochrome c
MKKIATISIVIIMVAYSTNLHAQEKWVAPKSADTIVNPFKNDLKATKKGKILYAKLCAICHGEKGRGDGVASVALNPKPVNFREKEFYEQSDGAIFWKLTEGNIPMAPYKDAVSEEQRWQLVNYIKTFKNK